MPIFMLIYLRAVIPDINFASCNIAW